MAQFVVRQIEDEVKRRLQRRAARKGHSLEAEVRDILRDAVKGEGQPMTGLGSEIAALFNGIEIDTEIAELRGHTIEPVDFGS
ncbi:MAG: hypothetical protein JO273_01345 [Methylobacteriaceae bacterium]|nr:hypothetical protein [Methylobacteriaceae bacterium]